MNVVALFSATKSQTNMFPARVLNVLNLLMQNILFHWYSKVRAEDKKTFFVLSNCNKAFNILTEKSDRDT